jgi:putative FmdB family regulatory protein
MPVYEHHCRACDLDWLEEYSVNDDPPTDCVECGSTDMYRCVTTSGAIQFKGPGWSPDGYSKDRALEKYKNQGIKIYDRREDHDREVKGQAEAAELRRLKRLDQAAKKAFGPDAGVSQNEAEAKMKKAGQERVAQLPSAKEGGS